MDWVELHLIYRFCHTPRVKPSLQYDADNAHDARKDVRENDGEDAE